MTKKRAGDGWSFRPAAGDEPPVRQISLPPEKQRIVVDRERRAKGKVVTVVRGLVLTQKDLKQLAKALKSSCGTGGTAKSGVIELQGDCRERPPTGNWWGLFALE